MSKQIEFGEIDFEAIEYRNEYRHAKAVFAFVAALALMWAPLPSSLSEEALVFWFLVEGVYLCLITLLLTALFIQYRSRVVITGQSLILKRPLLKDVEITYSEIGEVQVNGIVIRESNDSESDAINLSEAGRKWTGDRINSLNMRRMTGRGKSPSNSHWRISMGSAMT